MLLTSIIHKFSLPLKAKLSKKHRGSVPIMMALMIFMLISVIMADFQRGSYVELTMAINTRDELQAEFNAHSALNMRRVLIRESDKLKTLLSSLGPLVGSSLPDPSVLVSKVPVDCGILGATFVAVKEDVDLEDAKEIVADEEFLKGECSAESSSEHSKISVNALMGSSGIAKELQTTLIQILSDKKYERHFQEEDALGNKAESPIELVGAITDWVDKDEERNLEGGGDENTYYFGLDNSYAPKNAPLDSIKELQMVHGVDDEMFQILQDNVTIYSASGQIELPTAPFDRIVSIGLVAILREGVLVEDFLRHPNAPNLYRSLQDAYTMSFGMLKVANIRSLISANQMDTIFDVARLNRVFTDTVKDQFYTIKTSGSAGNVTKSYRLVYQSKEDRFYHIAVDH